MDWRNLYHPRTKVLVQGTRHCTIHTTYSECNVEVYAYMVCCYCYTLYCYSTSIEPFQLLVHVPGSEVRQTKVFRQYAGSPVRSVERAVISKETLKLQVCTLCRLYVERERSDLRTNLLLRGAGTTAYARQRASLSIIVYIEPIHGAFSYDSERFCWLRSYGDDTSPSTKSQDPVM